MSLLEELARQVLGGGQSSASTDQTAQLVQAVLLNNPQAGEGRCNDS